MDKSLLLKALADETRMNILILLLERNYCVRALARRLEITEAAVSQHLKVLRDAGLVQGERKGYFTHYDVQRQVLHNLAREIDALADIERQACTQEHGACKDSEAVKCHNREKTSCTDGQTETCHGHGEQGHGSSCRCHHQG